MSENEFAQRLGHANSGGVNPVISGSKALSLKKIEDWGRALELQDSDFEEWVEIALVAWGPTWLSRWVVEHRQLRREVDELKQLIYGGRQRAADSDVPYKP